MNPLNHPVAPSDSVSAEVQEPVLADFALSIRETIIVAEPTSVPSENIDRFSPRHGIDYVIDYYAVLGVSREASDDEIRKVYRTRAAGCHADSLGRASEHLQTVAEREFQLLGEARDALAPERRGIYDQLLLSFPERLVSKDGTAICDLSLERISIDYLVSGQRYQPSAEVEKYIQAHLPVNESVISFLETQLQGDTPVPPELRTMYRQQLVNKLALLGIREEQAWQDAGVVNIREVKHYAHPDAFVEERAEQFEKFREALPEAVEARLLLGGRARVPLFLTHEGSEAPVLDGSDIVQMTRCVADAATSRFDLHREALQEIAQERAAVMAKMLDLLDWRYIVEPAEAETSTGLVILLRQEEQILNAFHFWREVGTATVQSASAEGEPPTVLTVEAMRECFPGRAVAILVLEPELDIVLQMGRVCEDYFTARTSEDT